MPLRLLTLFGVAALLLLAAACGDDDDSETPTPTEEATPTPTPTPQPTPRPTPQETVCGENPDAALAPELRVASPARGDNETSPLEILASGETPVTLRATLYNEDEELITESDAADFEEGAELFTLNLSFTVTETTSACLWVYKVGEGDAPENVVQIPLELTTEEVPRGVCGSNPEPASLDTVEVDAPQPGDSVTSPLSVSGGILLGGGDLTLTLYDEDEAVITETTVTPEDVEPGVLASFASDVTFDVGEETEACLWVWEAEDGTPINVRQVAVTLQP